MNRKQIIYIILTIIWMITIFLFSNEKADSSTDTSKGLIYNVVSIYKNVINKDIDVELICEKFDHPVRKTAHFTLYFILGFFVYHVFLYSKTNWKNLSTIIICLMYSISDEMHQIFVPGRSGQISDVFIDMCGVILLLLIINIFYELVKNGKSIKN